VSQDRWNEVDNYFTDLLIKPDSIFQAVLDASNAADLPAISVSPPLGKLLELFVRSFGAKRVLEIGTLGGYSTIWMARGLPRDGKLITLESHPTHAAVARENISVAGFSSIVEVREGPALETLAQIAAEQLPPFDLTFIDADKQTYSAYLEWAIKLSRSGSVIIADNVVRDGHIVDTASEDERVQAVREFNEKLSKDARLDATAIQTVGSKGYDGFVLAVVK
jgi:predicted O-methyltransferase YrrM